MTCFANPPAEAIRAALHPGQPSCNISATRGSLHPPGMSWISSNSGAAGRPAPGYPGGRTRREWLFRMPASCRPPVPVRGHATGGCQRGTHDRRSHAGPCTASVRGRSERPA